MQRAIRIFVVALFAILAGLPTTADAANRERCEVVFRATPSTAKAAHFLEQNPSAEVETYIFRGGGITFFIHPSDEVTGPAAARRRVINILPSLTRSVTFRLERALAADDMKAVQDILYIKTEQDGFASAVRADTALYAMFVRSRTACNELRDPAASIRAIGSDRRAPGLATKPPRPTFASSAAVRAAGSAALRNLKGGTR